MKEPNHALQRTELRAVAELFVLHERQMMRELSDILIEIAMQGLKSPSFGHSAVMHPLMLLAHVAWNRETKSSDYMGDQYETELRKFPIPKSKLHNELVSEEWNVILDKMQEYKKARFPDDRRIITLCAFTPRETLRVEWIPSTEQNQSLEPTTTRAYGAAGRGSAFCWPQRYDS